MIIQRLTNATKIKKFLSFTSFDEIINNRPSEYEMCITDELIKIVDGLPLRPIILKLYRGKTSNNISFWVTQVKIVNDNIIFTIDVKY